MKSTKKDLINNIEVLRTMSQRERFTYFIQNGWSRTARLFTDYNRTMQENGIAPFELVTAKTLKEKGLPIPDNADIEVPNPHYKKSSPMKLYLVTG